MDSLFWTGVQEFELGYSFDTLNGNEVCKKYISKKNRRKLIKYLQEVGYEVEIDIINLPLKACIERDSFRGARSVGEGIIRQQWETLQQNLHAIKEEKTLFNIHVKMFDNYGAYEEAYV